MRGMTATPETDGPLIHPGTVGWQRTLWVMVGIQFVMTAAMSFLSPIIPLMLPQLGVETIEGVDIWSGLINGSTSFVAAFAAPIWGRIADKHGRKLSLVRSSCAIALFTGLMGLATNVWWFFGARALMGAFAGFSTSAIALVASQVPERRIGYALGWLATGQMVGSLVGPVLGGALADVTGSYRTPFFITCAATFGTLAMVWFLVKESFTPPKASAKDRSFRATLRLLTGSGALMALFFVLLICLLGATLTSLPQIWVDDYWVFVAERFAVGLFIGGIVPTANALIGRSVSRENRGTVYGMTASATFLGNSLGPLTGGLLAASLGLRWVFAVTTLLMVVNLVWVWFTVPEYKEGESGAGSAGG